MAPRRVARERRWLVRWNRALSRCGSVGAVYGSCGARMTHERVREGQGHARFNVAPSRLHRRFRPVAPRRVARECRYFCYTAFCYTRTPKYLIIFGIRARFLTHNNPHANITASDVHTCIHTYWLLRVVLVSAATGPTQCLSDKLLSLYSPYGGEDVHGAGATLSAPIKAVLEKNRI